MPDTCSEAALHAWISHILHDRWPRGGRPEGLRLELSPLAANRVLSCGHMRWELSAFTPDMGYPEILTGKFGLPVHIMKELEPGAWRLAIVTDEMLDEGKLMSACNNGPGCSCNCEPEPGHGCKNANHCGSHSSGCHVNC